MSLNQEILTYLNTLANTNNTMNKFVMIFADTPIFLLPLFLVWYWIYYSIKWKNKKKENLLIIFYSVVLSIIISLIIQKIFHVDRPENYLLNTWKLLLDHIPDVSFPSDHATVSFAFATSLFLSNYKKLWFIYIVLAIFMWIARISAWVHWPTDILWWMFVWIIWSFITFKYIENNKYVIKFNKFILKITSYIKL
jgi:undecaprenyl-diphosphatase